MNRTVFSALIFLLIASPALCIAGDPHITRLRLERATTPDGTWEPVAAETMPVVDGEFEDSFDSEDAFYRMRIDVVDDQRPPGSLSLSQVPPRSREIAQEHLDENRDIGGDNAWEGAELGPVVFPMYNPAIQGPAYFEFQVVHKPGLPPPGALAVQRLPLEDRGFILVSATRNDFPIVSYATQGPTRTKMLREMAESTGVRIFRFDTTFYVAENAGGEMVAHLGSEPVKYPDTICDYMGQEWEHIVDEQGVQEPTGTPELTGEPFASYAALKQAYLETEYLKQARRVRAEEATLEWDLYDGVSEQINALCNNEVIVAQEQKIERFFVGDPNLATIIILAQGLSITGKAAGATVLHLSLEGGQTAVYALVVTEEGSLSPDKPTGWGSYTTYYAGTWSDQRKYEQKYLSSEGCYTGCSAVAWAMLDGWFDYKGMADLIAPSGTGNAPEYWNAYVGDCIYTTRGYINSFCVPTSTSCATNPWNMPDGYKWASIDRGVHYSISTTYSIPCFPTSGCRDRAVQSIRYGGKPAIIGLWCLSAHNCVAYGYRYREYTVTTPLGVVTLGTDHDFKCNLGWGGSSPSWETGSVWYGNNPHFW